MRVILAIVSMKEKIIYLTAIAGENIEISIYE